MLYLKSILAGKRYFSDNHAKPGLLLQPAEHRRILRRQKRHDGS